MIVRATIACLIAVQALAFHTTQTLVGPSQGLKSPAGVAIGSDGTIYVADSSNQQIKAIAVDGTVTIIGGSGKPGSVDGIGTGTQVHAPSGLALDDAAGSLYIADTGNHVIRRLDLTTGLTSTVAGNGTPGFTDGSALQAQLHEPRGITLHQGVLYIADTRNHAIRAFDLGNDTITTVAGNGAPGFADGTSGLLKTPSATAADEHSLYVADTGNHSIRRLDLTTGELTTIAGTTQPGYLDGPGTNALFKDPQDITIERDTLYIADTGNHTIRTVSLLDASVATIAGTGKLGYQDGPTSTSQFKQPAGIIAAGALFVADTGNDAIRALLQTPTVISIDPTRGDPEGGINAIITGTGFVPGRTIVTFAGLEATVTWIDSERLSVIVPAGPSGTADVTVTTPGGTATLASGWTWLPPYVALEIRPSSALLAPGEAVQFRAIGIRADGIEVELAAVWTSSDGTIADVTQSGLVTAVALGEATITASAEGLIGSAPVSTQNPQEPPQTDPTITPSAIDPTVPTDIADATAFLYEGDDPVQQGVQSGVIAPERVAIIRGRVLTAEGAALSGVTVSILDHDEYGWTTTRENGIYDMAVNGGGSLTVRLRQEGYLPVQRRVELPWRDYVLLEDVVMIPLDPNATSITAGASSTQTATGSILTDDDGQRQAMMIFQSGTSPVMMLPDGTQQPLAAITVRATEYTVGENGPAAMPAGLPAASGYTYCVELSVDEAIAAGATSVVFDRPVHFYVENFLGFPVGSIVPVGSYDHTTGNWRAEDNGRVIGIVSIEGGFAGVDTDGDGAADNDGIDTEERAALAQRYAPGTTLWRADISHFTPHDLNWPFVPPVDAIYPSNPAPKVAKSVAGACEIPGSVIECENQALGEQVPIAGTPFSLSYRSHRLPGRTAGRTLDITLTPAIVPASLKRVDLVVTTAGTLERKSFDPSAGLTSTYQWDGRDAYGRVVADGATATVDITYVYDGEYASPAGRSLTFGSASSTSLGIPVRQEVFLRQSMRIPLETYDARGAGFGGWTLSPHHRYDFINQILLKGDGTMLDGGISQSRAAEYWAGNGDGGISLTTAPAHSEIDPFDMDLAPDGSLYIAEQVVIRRIRDGVIERIAGDGTWGYAGDGGPATSARIGALYITVAADGTVYVYDGAGRRVRRIRSGIITTIAGNGNFYRGDGSDGDGISAVEAATRPIAIDAGPDGELYLLEYDGWLRRVTTRGIIESVARLSDAPGSWPVQDLAVDSRGLVYFADQGGQIHRVDLNGTIDLFAGVRFCESLGDGGPANEACFRGIWRIDLDDDGNVYVADNDGERLRFIGTDGIVRTIGGNGHRESGINPSRLADRPFATGAPLSPYLVSAAPDGSVYTATSSLVIRRIAPVMPGFDPAAVLIADGGLVHVFELFRHTRTIDALTGVTIYQFVYDGDGLLRSISDVDGLTTTVERGAGGAPHAVVAPSGKRTMLGLDAFGFLSSITAPGGIAHQFQYTPEGLLRSMTTPKGHQYQFSYDDRGLLTLDRDPARGFQSLARTEYDEGFSVTTSNAEARHRVFGRFQSDDDVVTRRASDEAGLDTEWTTTSAGIRTTISPDGTIRTYTPGPDPRFGMNAPVTQQATITTPSGLGLSVSSTRLVAMGNIDDPFSMTSQTDTTTINGRAWTSVWTGTDRKLRATSPLGRSIEQFLDGAGRVTEVRVPGITPSTMSYDSRGRLSSVSQGSRTYTFTWNASDELVSVSDPLARSVSFGYDDAGRVTTQTLPDDRVIGFTYDENDNVTSITPPGRPAHTFSYNAVDLQTSYTAPAVDGLASTTTRYEYNLDRDLMTVTRADGVMINLTYDTGGRLGLLSAGTHAYSFGYDGSGRLSSIGSDTAVDLTYAWDGFLPTSVGWSGEVFGTVSWTYDNDFRVTSESAAGATVAYAYDADSLLTRAGDLTLARDSQNGRLTGSTLGTITDSYQYDALGQLAVYSASAGGSAILRVEYTRDDIGRITTKTETRYGVTFTESYGYDLAGRLTSVSRNGELTDTYEYDANGNRTRHDRWAGGALTSSTLGTYDAQDRLLSYGDASNTYTPNGELLTKTDSIGTTSYTYDALGNLRRVDMPDGTVIEYVIDGQNRRVGRKVDGVLERAWLYGDQLNPIAELDADGNVVSRFVYSSRLNVPDSIIRGGVTYRIVSDHLGSVRYVLDASTGTIVQSLDYDAWGNVLADSNPGFQPFAFAGGLHDSTTKLTRFGARDYGAEIGRFVVKDPMGFLGEDTNFYAYVYSDPVNGVDPSGLIVEEPGLVESFIPVWGSGKQAIRDFQCGNWGWGLFNTAMAGADVFGGGLLVKGGWKLGSHSWKMTRRWLGKRGLASKGQHVDHAIVPQRAYESDAAKAVFNQPWNLKPLTPPAGIDPGRWHMMVEGRTPGLNPAQRWLHRTPDWAKAAEVSATGKTANAVGNGGGCGCN